MTAATTRLPPLQPTYVLRGHPAAVHSLLFLRNNTRLLSGDADGWVVLWSVITKRPIAAWQAQDGTVVGLGAWGSDKLITHGREGKLRVWALAEGDEMGLSTRLPVMEQLTPFNNDVTPLDLQNSQASRHPWLLHELSIPTLNFCAFSSCEIRSDASGATSTQNTSLLVAAAGSPDTTVVLHHLPSSQSVSKILAPISKQGRIGMVMSVHLISPLDVSVPLDGRTAGTSDLRLAVGYENGQVAVFKSQATIETSVETTQPCNIAAWKLVYTCAPHMQPVLSVTISTSVSAVYSSGADAVLAKSCLPATMMAHSADTRLREEDTVVRKTGHSGQQSLQERSDGRIIATAGWDGRVRVYSAKTLRELAVCGGSRSNSAAKHAIVPAPASGTAEKVSTACHAITFAELSAFNKIVEHGSAGTIMSAADDRQRVRAQSAMETHWLASAGVDGRIALWIVY